MHRIYSTDHIGAEWRRIDQHVPLPTGEDASGPRCPRDPRRRLLRSEERLSLAHAPWAFPPWETVYSWLRGVVTSTGVSASGLVLASELVLCELGSSLVGRASGSVARGRGWSGDRGLPACRAMADSSAQGVVGHLLPIVVPNGVVSAACELLVIGDGLGPTVVAGWTG